MRRIGSWFRIEGLLLKLKLILSKATLGVKF